MYIIDDFAQRCFPFILTSIPIFSDDDVNGFASTILLGCTPGIVYVMQQLVESPWYCVGMTIVSAMSDRLPFFIAENVLYTTKVGIKDRDVVEEFSGRVSSRVMVETKASVSAKHYVQFTHKSELPATILHSSAE